MRPPRPRQIPLALALWAICFVALYGGQAVGCAVSPPAPESGLANWLSATLGIGSLAVAALLLALSYRCCAATRQGLAPEQRFIARLAAGVHLVAAVATLFIALPILRVPPCL